MQNQITKQDRRRDVSQTSYFVQTDCFKEDRDIRHPKHITVFLSKNVCFCLLDGVFVFVLSFSFFLVYIVCENRFCGKKSFKNCPLKTFSFLHCIIMDPSSNCFSSFLQSILFSLYSLARDSICLLPFHE